MRRRPSSSERARRPRLSDDIVRAVQAIFEGRQQLPSDYWKEFARGPYFIIAGEAAHGVLLRFHVSLGCFYCGVFFACEPGSQIPHPQATAPVN